MRARRKQNGAHPPIKGQELTMTQTRAPVYLSTWVINRSYFVASLWGLSEFKQVESLGECLAHSSALLRLLFQSTGLLA